MAILSFAKGDQREWRVVVPPIRTRQCCAYVLQDAIPYCLHSTPTCACQVHSSESCICNRGVCREAMLKFATQKAHAQMRDRIVTDNALFLSGLSLTELLFLNWD